MRKFINAFIKYLPLGLFLQSSYSQIQFNFRFHGVANSTDQYSPSWTVTSNPDHKYSLGTYQSIELLNDPYYFTTYLFDTSSALGSIAHYQKLADKNCTVADATLEVLFPIPTNAYILYVLSGESCADNGLLKMTHLNASGGKLEEIKTITAAGFTASAHENDGLPWSVPPSSNYGKSDAILPLHTSGSDVFSVTRAGVGLRDNGAPHQINITRAVYDFQLQQKNISHEYYDLSALPNNSLIQWYYTAPYLAVGILSVGSKTIFVNLYSAQSKTVSARVNLPESDDLLIYDMSLHAFNASSFLLYNRIINPEQNDYHSLFLLHRISMDGNVEFLGSKPTRGISSLLVLQQDHGAFLRGSVLTMENTADYARPNLTVFSNNQKTSFLLPDSPWWLLDSWSDDNALVEGFDALHLVEMNRLDAFYELGCYNLDWATKTTSSPREHLTTLPSESIATSTTSLASIPNTESISTNRNTFFSSVVNDRSEPESHLALAIGLSVGFLLLIASSITACIVICCRKTAPYKELNEDQIYSV